MELGIEWIFPQISSQMPQYHLLEKNKTKQKTSFPHFLAMPICQINSFPLILGFISRHTVPLIWPSILPVPNYYKYWHLKKVYPLKLKLITPHYHLRHFNDYSRLYSSRGPENDRQVSKHPIHTLFYWVSEQDYIKFVSYFRNI